METVALTADGIAVNHASMCHPMTQSIGQFNTIEITAVQTSANTGMHGVGKLKEKRRQRSHYATTKTNSYQCTLPLYYQYLLTQSLEMVDSKEHLLPLDPRSWSKYDVRRWLYEISIHHDIDPTLDCARFPFNGKALCGLTLQMFQCRAPFYGKLLYKDIRLRLAKAVATTNGL